MSRIRKPKITDEQKERNRRSWERLINWNYAKLLLDLALYEKFADVQ
jgi:hypothetical protein